MIYLDHAATTPIEARALEAMANAPWANPSAPYSISGAARREMRRAREVVSAALNADAGQIVWTSGGTEANNLAAMCARGAHAVVSSIEHASVIKAVAARAAKVTYVDPAPDGRVRPEDVGRAVRPDTRLISVQIANNETGVLQPVREIGMIARERRIPFHCDAVQGFGQIPIDVRDMNIDLLSLSAHKFYGPRGAGALYVRQGTEPEPLMLGGGQELGLRAGTENVPGICGLRAAAELALNDMDARAEREREWLGGFVDRIVREIPGARLLCAASERLPGLCALYLPGKSAEQAIAKLDVRGIAVSGGAACASREHELSRAYVAAGLTAREAGCVLRVSVGRHTTREDMDAAAEAFCAVYAGR